MAYPRTRIKTASFSRLNTFETCEYQAKLRFVDKVPEKARVPPPGKAEHPIDRGSRIHAEAEAFVKAEREDFPTDFKKLKRELEAAREVFQTGEAQVEQTWAFDEHWQVTAPPPESWAFYWLVKVDLAAMVDLTHMLTVDYKTGKGWNKTNEFVQQLQLYAIAAFMRYPHLEQVTGEVWMSDLGKVLAQIAYTRRQALALLPSWNQRAQRMTTTVVFEPKPSDNNCRFCPHGGLHGTGFCEFDAHR